ncbi:hypothetical protein H4R26_002439 [Coemansia thaxteri]|uniref:Uncharacterized protein n=1 Tax=Coemansia thaxteri TaxID=2663907 RepID=A0A9W8BEW0_9FUNG|nr:hypothetical protein H4R26_002439 [Coemansia thaxteri]KAJ2481767.1 hypothetical protein EV174_003387 [Coemansia sp. RSA 2320]
MSLSLPFGEKPSSPLRFKLLISCVVFLAVILTAGLLLVTRPDLKLATRPVEAVHAQPVDGKLPYANELSSLQSILPVKNHITTTVFMFRGDFSSPLHDLFVLHKRAMKICDKDTKADGCDIKMAKNYKWGTLANKLVDTLDMFCNYSRDKKTDFYVKIDDDLIMSESELEKSIRKMTSTNCLVAGGIAVDYPFYWPVGQIYIFKRSVFDTICKRIPNYKTQYPDHEDITLGALFNSTVTDEFCSLDRPAGHWHKEYKDQRVKISYLQQHNE